MPFNLLQLMDFIIIIDFHYFIFINFDYFIILFM